jgi:hypothetical protein
MSSNGWPTTVPPFPPEYGASGLLLHVSSLPSPYGIDNRSVRAAAPATISGQHHADDPPRKMLTIPNHLGILRISRCRRLQATPC